MKTGAWRFLHARVFFTTPAASVLDELFTLARLDLQRSLSANSHHVVDGARVASREQLDGFAQRCPLTGKPETRQSFVDCEPLSALVLAGDHYLGRLSHERGKDDRELHGRRLAQIERVYSNNVESVGGEPRLFSELAKRRLLRCFANLDVPVHRLPGRRAPRIQPSLKAEDAPTVGERANDEDIDGSHLNSRHRWKVTPERHRLLDHRIEVGAQADCISTERASIGETSAAIRRRLGNDSRLVVGRCD